MPLETASHISDLTVTNPASNDPTNAGDDHIRLIKAVLKNTFPGLNAPVTRTPAQMNYPVPIGTIMLWYGSIGTIPAGWAVCNGGSNTRTDGGGAIVTPDLRGRVALGATAGFDTGTSGGAYTKSSEAAGAHTHDISVASAGSHTHGASSASAGAHVHTGTTNAGGNHDHGGQTNSAGAHTHGGATGGTTLTESHIPAHRHFVVVPGNDEGSISAGRGIAENTYGGGSNDATLRNKSGDPTVGRSSSFGDSNPHSHSIASEGHHQHDIPSSGTHTHGFTSESAGAHSHSIDVVNGGTHTHPATSATAGIHSHTIDVVQPYVALHYIMKI